MNRNSNNSASTTALVLVGGMGTRLRPAVSDRPKPLALVDGRPFLAHLLSQLRAAGVQTTVLCSGYLGEQLEQVFGRDFSGMELLYSREETSLGTAGALRLALDKTSADPLLALNGDSYIDFDLRALLAFHRPGAGTVSMLLCQVPDVQRYGRVLLGDDGRVLSFEEKGSHRGPGLINAGVYVVDRQILTGVPAGQNVSLERQVFPGLTDGRLRGLVCQGRFIDIGTPESYAAASEFFQHLGAKTARVEHTHHPKSI